MRRPGDIVGLCWLVTLAGCANPASRWYPGQTIVLTVDIARDIHDTRKADEQAHEQDQNAARAADERAREEAAAARMRAREQEPAAPSSAPSPSPLAPPTPQQLATQRSLARAQAGASGPAQGFARAVLALTRQPADRSAEELAALAAEAAGYLQSSLASSSLRRTAADAWRRDTHASFCLLGELPRAPAVDDALVRGCKPARPAMAAEQVPAFMAECRERAGGRTNRLVWAGVDADLGRAANGPSDRSHCGPALVDPFE